MIARTKRPLPEEQLAPFRLDAAVAAVPFDFRAVFGNDRPVEVEVGPGKGAFLVASGERRRDVNLIGIEVSRPRARFSLNRVAKRRLVNVRVMHDSAPEVLRDAIAPGSLAAIHLYFPDPWWKKRHQKRKVVTPAFVQICASRLAAGGRIFVATDVPHRFEEMDLYFRAADGLERSDDDPILFADLVTNFEEFARREGRPILRAVYRRTR